MENEIRRRQLAKTFCSVCQAPFRPKEKVWFCYAAYYGYHWLCFQKAGKQKCPDCRWLNGYRT